MSYFRKGILQHLVQTGRKVVVIAPPDFKSQELIDLGCEFYPLPFQTKTTSPLADILLVFKIYKLYKKIAPEIVFQYTIKPNVYGSIAAKLLGITSVPVVTGLGYAFTHKTWINRLVKKLYWFSFLGLKEVWFLNQDDVNLFVKSRIIPEVKAKILPGEGVNMQHYAYCPIENNHKKFLLIARMLWDKGISEFVEAARLIKKDHPDYSFLLMGPTGSDNPNAIPLDLIQKWENENVITYLGSSDDVATQIKEATAVVLPSYREGISKVLMEAASIGRPLVASNVAGCKELIEHGLTGYLCEVKNPKSLATQLIKLGTMSVDQLNKMGLAASNKMAKEFDEKHVIEFYMGTIKRKSAQP